MDYSKKVKFSHVHNFRWKIKILKIWEEKNHFVLTLPLPVCPSKQLPSETTKKEVLYKNTISWKRSKTRKTLREFMQRNANKTLTTPFILFVQSINIYSTLAKTNNLAMIFRNMFLKELIKNNHALHGFQNGWQLH